MTESPGYAKTNGVHRAMPVHTPHGAMIGRLVGPQPDPYSGAA